MATVSPSDSVTHPPHFPTDASIAVSIHLDVEQLDRSVTFYERVLGFRVVHAVRTGMLLETNVLQSEHFAGVEIMLRESFGKRVTGSQAGSMTAITLPVKDLEAEIRRLLAMTSSTGPERVRWVGQAPIATLNPDETRTTVRLLDPDAYVFELRQR